MRKLIRATLWLLLLSGLSGCGYNTLQTADEQIKSSWAEVLNQYQRRADLVPNLVNVVKGYAAHEKEVLTRVTEARAVWAPPAASFARWPAACWPASAQGWPAAAPAGWACRVQRPWALPRLCSWPCFSRPA